MRIGSDISRIVNLSPDCTAQQEPTDIPASGHLVVIGSVSTTAAPTEGVFDPPAFSEVARCDSIQEE